MTETLAEAIEAWARDMQAAGCTPVTVSQRRRLVARVARDHGDLRAWVRDDAVRFLAGSLSWAPNTRVTYYSGLKGFFDFLEETERIHRSPMRKVRRPKRPRGIPRPVETDVLQLAVATATGDLRAWLLLAAYEGLRVSEVARFRGEQIRGDQLRITGKGGVVAVLPVHPLVAALARQYPARGYWFPPQPGRPRQYPHIRPNTITTNIGLHLRTLGEDGATHRFRHWFATASLDASGGNLRTVQGLMRHASVSTTETYTRIKDTQRTAAVLALPDVVTSVVTP